MDTRSLIWGMSVKVAFWLYLLILLAGTAACGDGHAGTPTELSATETPERPTTTPTEQPHTETPQTPISEIPLDHPAAPLALLPVDASSFTFVDIESVGQRPAFQDDVEFQLSHFVSGDEIPFAEELLRSIGARSLALSSPDDRFEWACVLRGDFAQVQSALRQAAESGVGLSVSIIETHRQVEIFALVRERASSESEVYLTVLDEQTLAVSPDLDAMREIINRLQDSLSLPETLAMMLQDWGLPNYLQVFKAEIGTGGIQSSPIEAVKLYGVHATLGEEAATVLRFLFQFDDEEQASAAAAAWLGEQEEPHYRNAGYGSGVQVDRWRASGPTVYAEVIVPDEDVLELITPN